MHGNVRFDDTRKFREQADPLLLADEAANNLILGVTQTVIDHPQRFDSFIGWVLMDEGQPSAAAAQTVPYKLDLQRVGYQQIAESAQYAISPKT